MPPRQTPHRSTQNYRTPQCLLDPIKTLLGIEAFAFDFAAERANHRAQAYWTQHEDSLSKSVDDWVSVVRDGWGWLNPPYADIRPWAERCRDVGAQGGRVALLVPAGVGANWYRDYIHQQAFVLALNGRIPFMPHKPQWLYPKDCILCLYGPDFAPGFDMWTWRT